MVAANPVEIAPVFSPSHLRGIGGSRLSFYCGVLYSETEKHGHASRAGQPQYAGFTQKIRDAPRHPLQPLRPGLPYLLEPKLRRRTGHHARHRPRRASRPPRVREWRRQNPLRPPYRLLHLARLVPSRRFVIGNPPDVIRRGRTRHVVFDYSDRSGQLARLLPRGKRLLLKK
jgi:hypothetical protein